MNAKFKQVLRNMPHWRYQEVLDMIRGGVFCYEDLEEIQQTEWDAVEMHIDEMDSGISDQEGDEE